MKYLLIVFIGLIVGCSCSFERKTKTSVKEKLAPSKEAQLLIDSLYQDNWTKYDWKEMYVSRRTDNGITIHINKQEGVRVGNNLEKIHFDKNDTDQILEAVENNLYRFVFPKVPDNKDLLLKALDGSTRQQKEKDKE